MKIRPVVFAWLCAAGLPPLSAQTRSPLTPVSFENVELTDNFWKPRLVTQKTTLVPFALEKTAPAVENLRRVGAWLKQGKKQKLEPLPRYVASDLFKVMEGAAYLLKSGDDPELERTMDEIIDVIADAQMPDGYLYELFSVPEDMREMGWGAGDSPYSFVVHSHELYNAGHMYEGAVAYWRATGKRKWLDVAEKNARHINRVFFEGDPAYNGGKPVNQAPGHEEIELALVKLWQATGDTLYLNLAKKFIDVRGVTYCPEGEGVMAPSYAQQHLPVREQRTAEGHSVRAMYLYSGMADVMGATGDTTLQPALESIWHNFVDRKMHINGGLGAIPGIEGFGPDYDLPNKNTYDETCAAVGNVLFNYRMYLASGDAKYLDVAETALYNNVLAGVNLEGNKFFYVNVLEADGRKNFNHGRAGRSPWFGTACCPSNLARLLPQVAGMVYSHSDDAIYCGLYAACDTEIPLAEGKVALKQLTGYPFSGAVQLEINPEKANQEFAINLRIPTWTGDRFVPGELYRFVNPARATYTITVNGQPVETKTADGFATIKRKWNKGDVVRLNLPMPVRYSKADPRVEADRNRACVTRGPLLYCAEGFDNAYPASAYVLDNLESQGSIGTLVGPLLSGISTIMLPAEAVTDNGMEEARLTLIPYYAWDNRGDNGTMCVWFALDEATAKEGLVRTAPNVADVSASYTWSGDDSLAVADGQVPKNSSDGSIPRWTSWPKKGETQQVEIQLKKEQPIESISVYWYDDAGGVQVPASWSAEYLDNGNWKAFELYTTDLYGVQKDQYNVIHPASEIKTSAVRLTITPQPEATVGILETVIE